MWTDQAAAFSEIFTAKSNPIKLMGGSVTGTMNFTVARMVDWVFVVSIVVVAG